MKIGVFDSGLGGLLIFHAIAEALPNYDYLYLGDTAHVPYGDRAQTEIYQFTKQAVEYLFANDCELVIIACNSASTEALRQLQQEYLPAHYPKRRILGVLIPAAEVAVEKTKNKRVGIIGTNATVASRAFTRELGKLDPTITVFDQATPKLVPLIEGGKLETATVEVKEYLKPLLENGVDTLILGCTHYPLLKTAIRRLAGSAVVVISQDEVVPDKLRQYLSRHPEIETQLSQGRHRTFLVTDSTAGGEQVAVQLFGSKVRLEKITL